MERYLKPTAIIDSDHRQVIEFARSVVGDTQDPRREAVSLYRAVRDSIWYDPYAPFYRPEHYRASFVLQRGRSFCIPKAALLCALARARGIPCRLGFANVRNHLATRQLLEYLGSDQFVFHGFVEFHLDGQWIKATPAFNRELCQRHGVEPLEFDGIHDSLFHPYNKNHQKYMEYEKYLGTYDDVPVAEILEAWRKTYGKERVESWIRELEKANEGSGSRFETEDIWSDES